MGECLDLVSGLPDGSLYVRATCPERAWSEARALTTDVREAIINVAESTHGVPDEALTHLPRPWDARLERMRAERADAEARRAEEARKYIESQKWEAV